MALNGLEYYLVGDIRFILYLHHLLQELKKVEEEVMVVEVKN
jgi:hypothetical protein